MLISDIFQLATRMFRTNRSRTILTILGISVGIGAILFLVSLGYGLQLFILNRITNSEALLSLDVNTGELESLKLDDASMEDMKKIAGVDRISPLFSVQSQVTLGDISSELQVNFANREYFRLDGTALMKGEFYDDSDATRNKVIISSAALQLFSLSPDEAVGKELNFVLFPPMSDEEKQGLKRETIELAEAFVIGGVIEEENSSYVFLPFAVSDVLPKRSYSQIKVKVTSEELLDPVRSAIMDRGFVVSALSDIIEQANQIFTVIQIVLASFGIVALIVSAIGMFNTMTIALLERTQEIGIMKALGATSLDIWSMFLSESVIIGFLGGAGGIAMGLMGGEFFNYGINLLAGALGGEKIDMFYSPPLFIAVIIIFSTLVGLATGFYPARRAARINCLEALRYK